MSDNVTPSDPIEAARLELREAKACAERALAELDAPAGADPKAAREYAEDGRSSFDRAMQALATA